MQTLRTVGPSLVLAAGLAAGVAPQQGGDGEVALEYGFRHEPMEWLRGSTSIPAAQIRALLLDEPHQHDAAILQAEIERILSHQSSVGSLGDDTSPQSTTHSGWSSAQARSLPTRSCHLDREV